VTPLGQAQNAGGPPPTRIPVIFDSDFGDDIDDTWALGLLLKSPELDLRLAVGDHGKSLYRARLLAKFLERAGRTDVPVGIGLDANVRGDGPQAAWIKDYNLNGYPGRVYPDGVQAMIDLILQSPVPITVIAVGPLPNLAAALEREPGIARRARFVGMHGSVRVGYGGSKDIAAEYNVKEDAKACQKVFTAAWDITITPLDTCGLIDLSGDHYRTVREASDPVAQAVIENYRIWNHRPNDPNWKLDAQARSSTLFDTVAVYLAFAQDLVTMEQLAIKVTNDGFTRIDPNGKTMAVATAWKDLEGFRALLTRRLTEPKPGGK
jgi:inosine-uridine nucleoside N-ribohydrolase